MKNIRFYFISIVVLCGAQALAGGQADVIRLSEPAVADAASETFGAPIDESLPAAGLGELVADPDAWLGRPVRVTARVAEVCQKKGCFLVATDGRTTLRVSFVDYSFFVPTDAAAKRVTLTGELVRVQRSADEAAHIASDLGSSGADIATGPALEIVATAVRIPRS